MNNWKPSAFQLILFAIGGGLLYLGEDWGIRGATEVGIAFLGVLLAAVGIDIGLKRLAAFREAGWANVVDTYRGLLELLWGAIFICLGILIVTVVTMTWLVPGGVGNFWSDMLLSSTGIGAVVSVVGLMLMLNGLIRALSGSGRVNPKLVGGLAGVLDRLAGAVTLGVGAALSVIGMLLLIAPEWVTAGLERLSNLVR